MNLDQKIEAAKAVLDQAVADYEPVALFAGFSGGHDSLVASHLTLAHFRERGLHARALHINTGIGIERTRRYVRETARAMGWDFWERHAAEGEYERFVRTHGFPGPAQHPRMYQRLKERVVYAVVKEAKREEMARRAPMEVWEAKALKWCERQRQKHEKSAGGDPFWLVDAFTEEHMERAYNQFSKPWKVLFSTGIRAEESVIRAGYNRQLHTINAQVWVNPIYRFTKKDLEAYMARYSLPRNPVKDTLGMSGECLCSAFADWGERAIIKKLEPETDAYLTRLEEEVWNSGLPWRWGDPGPPEWYTAAKRGQMMMFDPEPDCPWEDRLLQDLGLAPDEYEEWCAVVAQEREQQHLEWDSEWVGDPAGDGCPSDYVGPMCWGCGKAADTDSGLL